MLPVTGEDKDSGTYSSRRRELGQKTSEESPPLSTLITAVVITAIVTLAVAVLLFYCFYSFFSSGLGVNDEKPLLSLSLSDNSAGKRPFHLFPYLSCLYVDGVIASSDSGLLYKKCF